MFQTEKKAGQALARPAFLCLLEATKKISDSFTQSEPI
jgi:hypothetical protein